MFEKFTEKCRKIILYAKEEAEKRNSDYLCTEHILLAILREENGIPLAIMKELGLTLQNLRYEVENHIPATKKLLTFQEIHFTLKAKRVLELAVEESKLLGHSYISSEHLFLALIREEGGIAGKLLRNLGINLLICRQLVINFSVGLQFRQSFAKEQKKTSTQALDAFGRNLTKLAREGKLDPVIGRVEDIERVIQVLGRRLKNNPAIIGETGAGKTAIVEGLAQKIVSCDVPDILLNKKIISLDLGLIIAGTKYRGQFEERLKLIMREIQQSKDIILFIDEFHTIIGAGSAEGSVDAANMLKPPLSRGEIQCIGATTFDEYRKYIEKDPAFERRFQPIYIQPSTVNETIDILKGLRPKYEEYHKVKIPNEAIVLAVRLSDRYITGRFLPDKAIDVIDETSSRIKLKKFAMPKNLKDLETKLYSIIKEKDLQIRNNNIRDIQRLTLEKEKINVLYEIRYKKWRDSIHNHIPIISEDDISLTVSKITGIPLYKIEEAEAEKLLKMEEILHLRIIGQNNAVKSIAQAIRRSRAGLKHKGRPGSSFFFLGPTGVGKTELAKVLAEFMFNDENALIKIDMSEYAEKISSSRLSGAPPGYIGYEQGGDLTEKVRKKPYSVVLFDEIEKAHPNIYNILLQILDEGVLTDNFGRKIDFKNTIIIMTSNVGTRTAEKFIPLGFYQTTIESSYDKIKDNIIIELKKTFNPEFINRVDEIVVFHQLGKEHLFSIIDLFIKETNKKLLDHNLRIEINTEVKEWLLKKYYQPIYGARPMRRAITKEIEDLLSEKLLMGKFKNISVIKVFIENDKIAFIEENEFAMTSMN